MPGNCTKLGLADLKTREVRNMWTTYNVVTWTARIIFISYIDPSP